MSKPYVDGQFLMGDMGWKRNEFWNGGRRTCPHCQQPTTRADTLGGIGAYGDRAGDEYGTEIHYCTGCWWITSIQWDEAAQGNYYEFNYDPVQHFEDKPFEFSPRHLELLEKAGIPSQHREELIKRWGQAASAAVAARG